jgi:hypothetical protein
MSVSGCLQSACCLGQYCKSSIEKPRKSLWKIFKVVYQPALMLFSLSAIGNNPSLESDVLIILQQLQRFMFGGAFWLVV